MSKLFSPIQFGGIALPNRIVVSPMCQYSADDGSMTDWHMQHIGSLACSGAGLVMVEKTNVTREGRITHGCTGLYSDANESAMAAVVKSYRKITKHPIGVQLGHAGRKGSANVPWVGVTPLAPDAAPWETVAPSALPFGPGWHVPREFSVADLKKLRDDYASAAQRALRIGFDVVEIHSAHGYLLHQFLSPISNRRTDAYGQNRMKFPLEVAQALRDVWPKDRALGARITANDWIEGGFGADDAVAYARELKKIGLDFACVSTGGIAAQQKIKVEPGYQVPYAEKVKKAVGIATQTVGMIADPAQAEAILAEGRADMVAMARAFLDDPRWVWHAAERLGAKIDYPPQYARAAAAQWPGAALVRPRETA